MANLLGRDIKKGEAIILKGHYGKKFIVTSGFGMYHTTAGRKIWGYFEDNPNREVGPIDATWAIDVERTKNLSAKTADDIVWAPHEFNPDTAQIVGIFDGAEGVDVVIEVEDDQD